ncbi:MAG: hypothetical protein NE334_12530 [Lentisphaeraceae bacterium]|nr:hypothetical protein [Lentisphaeraceae bacterium]
MSAKHNNFFPLCAELIENPIFMNLPITEKIFLIQLISDSNQNPNGWYKADLEYSVIINVSIQKIRQARPKLKQLGLIDYKSGQLKRNRKIATEYTNVKFSRPSEQFARVHRYTYESLLEKVRRKYEPLARESILFWLLSNYKSGTTLDTEFYVNKSFYHSYKLSSSKINDAASNFNDLMCEDYIRTNHHKVIFSSWYTFNDPEVNERNLSIHEGNVSQLKDKITRAREEEAKKNGFILIAQIRAMNKQGLTRNAISNKLNISHKKVRDIASQNNIIFHTA